MKIAINEIKLNNGCDRSADGRTVASETRLKPDTKVEYYACQYRIGGTGYNNDIYRICGTLDALIIRHKDGGVRNFFWDNVRVEKEFFSYGGACQSASRKLELPMEVCLAVSPDLCEEFKDEATKVTYQKGGFIGSNTAGFPTVEPYKLDDRVVNELYAGIRRRKAAILSLLDGCSEELKMRISNMGQKNSKRIARYFIAMANN